MDILIAISPPKFIFCSQIGYRKQKSGRLQLLRRCRTGGTNLSGDSTPAELGSPKDIKVNWNHLNPTSDEKEEKQIDVWELFNEAKQNILYLNNQRIMVMEKLERVKNERDSLLDKVKQLEMERPTDIRRDKFTVSSQLLLRIDSLVLEGLIGSTEASDLRRFIQDSRGSSADDLYDIFCKNDTEFLAELRHLSKKSRKLAFHIIHICTEMWPMVAVGSLASYITGLSHALQRRGNLVEVILPKYSCLNLDEVQGLREVEAGFYSYFNGQLHENRIWTGVIYGIGVTFIQPVYYSSLFSQDEVYGYSNDFERFTYFSRASLDYLVKTGKRPDVLHIHNWQTSIVGPLFWDVFVSQGFEGTRVLLTCQGFDSQCLEQPEKLALCGLDPSMLLRPDRLQDNNHPHLVNLLKGGIIYSNKVIVMSSLQTKGWLISALSHGLEPTLTIHKEKLVIAPFGLDRSIWDPSRDNFLPQSYSADDMSGKSICKVVLQQRVDLPEEACNIVVGCIYSGILNVDLEKLKMLVLMASKKEGVQFIFMGSGKNPGERIWLENFHKELNDGNVRFFDEYDEELSHLIISGSDIMLCPCFEDPLHQVPLKALKYGAAPIPLNVADSKFWPFVGDDNDSTKFSQYINYSFANMSLFQAIEEIKNNPSQWNKRIVDAMGQDFSWDSECADVHIDAYAAIKRL